MRKLNILYVSFLITIALLMAISTYISKIMLDRSENDHTIINISGKQRMLNQRIIKCLTIIYYSENINEQKIKYRELKQSLNEWSKIDKEITKYQLENGSSNIKTELLVKELTAKKQKAFKVFNNFLLTNNELPDKLSTKEILTFLAVEEKIFSYLTNQITNDFENSSKEHINSIKDIIQFLFLLLLIILILHSVFIFSPMSKKISNTIKQLDVSKKQLSEWNHNLEDKIADSTKELLIINEELQKLADKQTAFNDVLMLTISKETLNEKLNKVLNILLSLHWLSLEKKGAIFLANEEKQELTLAANNNLGEKISNICSIVPYGSCHCGRAALNKDIVFSNCLDNLHEITYDGIQPHGHFCIPILFEDKLIGVINVYIKNAFERNHYDDYFFKTFAYLVAHIIKFHQSKTEVETLNKYLVGKNKELEEFTYITSHDLQEPLRTISSFVEIIEKEYSEKNDTRFNEYFKFIVQGTDRMRKLIKSVLDYSRLGKNPHISQIDINEVLKNVLEDINTMILETKAKVTFEKLPIIYVHFPEIKQLFQNLIINAIKYRKKDVLPEIEISAKKIDNFWIFSVKDNGIGIDDKHKDKIFQIFQRLHKRSEFEGLGIGLAFCKKIIELHNGNIWIKSEVGIETTFYFTISDTLLKINEQ